jgi:hypothetical protein
MKEMKENELGGACGTHWKEQKKHTGFWWRSLKRGIPPGRLRCSWKDNIKEDLKGIGWDGVNWINLP